MKTSTRKTRAIQRKPTRVSTNPSAPRTSVDNKGAVILVAVDFSSDSKKALSKAAELADIHNASLAVVHVMDGIYRPGSLESRQLGKLKGDACERAKRELVAFVKGEIDPNQKAKLILRSGTPHEEIVDAAKSQNAGLVIIGSRGNCGLKRMLLGSTAERVVRLSGCPVLVVR